MIQGLPADEWYMGMRADYFRAIRWHLRRLRKWLVTVDAFSHSRARQRQLRVAFEAVLDCIKAIEWYRKSARECLEYARLYRLDPTR